MATLKTAPQLGSFTTNFDNQCSHDSEESTRTARRRRMASPDNWGPLRLSCRVYWKSVPAEKAMRRFWSLVMMLLIGAASLCATSIRAQDADRDVPGPRLTVAPHREVMRALDEARRAIEKKQFHPAAQLLQSVLDRDEDFFVEQTFRQDGRNFRDGRGGVKAVALQLLRTLPAEGRAAYELDYGSTARDELTTAQEDDDFERIATVARRFSLTNAGFEAVVVLAARASDCDRPLEAALLLETLRGHPAAVQKRTPQILLNAAACWSRAGRAERSLATLKELKQLAPANSIRVAGRDVKLFANDDDAGAWLASILGPTTRSSRVLVDSWTMPGGGPTRNESAVPASPVGGDLWRVSLFEHLAFDGRADADRQRRTQLEGLLAKEQLALRDENRLAIPAAQPLVIGDTVVYRTISDVTAVSLRTGELLWRSSLSDGTLTRLWNNRNIEARGGEVNEAIRSSLSSHLRRRLFRDAAAGTLSSDGQTVFALEELDSVASTANMMRGIAESAIANKLVAYDLAGGRMLWEAGGPRGAKPIELSGHFFLGPPLPLNGRLYCLAEVQGDLRLLVLEQEADRSVVRLDWSQTLIATDRPVISSPMRRLAGLSPSFGDGILLCPTSSGAIVAVDPIRRVLMWGHQYRSTAASEPLDPRAAMFMRGQQQSPQIDDADETSRWLDSLPLMSEGRAIITPRDADELQCLDALDGRVVWKLPRGDWLYPACVVDGRVVLVGRDGLAAFQLDDGKPVDTFASISVDPAGRGVRVGSRYFLPLANGEIATVDLRSGRILARSKLSEGRVPGNLIAGAGALVSQNAGELIGFARLGDIEAQIADELKADPQQPGALALRGELRLHRGEEADGLADLRESLRRRPDPRVKSVLAASLLAGLRGNAKLVHDRAAELETLTDDPQQRNEFLRLYARALEEAGDRRGAFAQLIRLAETSRFLSDLDAITSNHSVRTDRAIRARLIETYQAASPEDREAFDKALAQHVETVRKGADLGEHLDQCLRFFAGLPRVEQLLFDQVVSIEGAAHPEKLLERFAQASDPSVAARATALLARDLLQANRASAALPWLNRLREEFADQKCLEDQTGRSLAERWLARDDVRKLLDVASVWMAGTIDVSRKQGVTPNRPNDIAVEVTSRHGTLFDNWSFEADAGYRTLTARDANSRVRWKAPIPPDAAFNDIVGRNLPVACQLHLRDRWLALTVGTYFVVYQVVDPDQAPQLAWQQTLRTNRMTQAEAMFAQQAHRMRIVNGQVIRMGGGPFNGRVLGQFVGLTREVAIYIVGQKLCAAELDTGRLAWSRQDVLPGAVSASADDRAVTIQPSATRNLTLLRTLDGSSLVARHLAGDEKVLWQRGVRLLVQRTENGKRITELRDLERDVALWNQSHAPDAVAAVIDDDDVAILEPGDQQSRLTVVALADGRERYRSELPFKKSDPATAWMAVQRQGDRDIVFVGYPSKVQNGVRVVPFDSPNGINLPFDGQICAVSRVDGRLNWATPVAQAIFDRTQPAQLPILLLAAREINQARQARDPFGARLRLLARVIDKRTGRELYATEENAPNNSPRLESDPDNHRVVANFHDWQLELTFPESKPDKPPIK